MSIKGILKAVMIVLWLSTLVCAVLWAIGVSLPIEPEPITVILGLVSAAITALMNEFSKNRSVKDDNLNEAGDLQEVTNELLESNITVATFENASNRGRKGFKSKKLIISFIIVFITVVGYLTISNWFNNDIRKVSIAIIPFHNQTKDVNLDSYGFGIASEIRTQLALSGQFDYITSDQATLKYRNSNLSPKEIANELNVDYLLIGNFYEIGNQLKITAELSDAITNKSLWSLPINLTSVESVKQLFDVQEEISKKVMSWFSFAGKVASILPTNNLAAYQYYLEAKENWQKKLPIAEEQFRKAVRLDSNFLSAWVGLFLVQDHMIWKDGNDKIIREKDLKFLLNKIDKLSPNSWETNLAKGVFYYHQLKEYRQGLEFLMKSIRSNSESDEATSYAGAIHRRRLNHDTALSLVIKSIDIDPKGGSNWNELALIFKDNGNLKDALRSELLAKKMGFSNYPLIAYFALEDSALFQLPNDVQHYFGLHYSRNLAKEQRDWDKLISIANTFDTPPDYTNFIKNMDRSFAYYFKDKPELAKAFAINAQKEMRDKVFFKNQIYPEDIYILLGEKEKGLQLFEERIANDLEIKSHYGQDISEICSYKIDRIILLAFSEQYDAATTALKELNKQYPEWGNYRLLYTDFRMGKIRKNYPPFNKALSDLKLPKRLEFPEKFKNM